MKIAVDQLKARADLVAQRVAAAGTLAKLQVEKGGHRGSLRPTLARCAIWRRCRVLAIRRIALIHRGGGAAARPGRSAVAADRDVSAAVNLRAPAPSTRAMNVTLQGGGVPMKSIMLGLRWGVERKALLEKEARP
jgi:hypothetical protein